MKFKIAMGLVLAGLCVHSYADLVVVGKNQANTNSAQPTSSNNSSKLPKNKPLNSLVSKNCNEMSMIANKAITARLDGERVHTIQAKVEEMYHGSSSPVKNDKLFNYMAHKVVLSAYAEKNIPPSNDLKARNALKANFTHNQKVMCVEYMNQIVQNQKTK